MHFTIQHAILFLVTAVAGIAYGAAIGRYEVFPYRLIARGKRKASGVAAYHRPSQLLFEEFTPNVTYVMVGDSLVEAGLWSEFFPRASIANRGVGGDSTDRILQRIQGILAVRPETAFIMVGINDILRGASIDAILRNYSAIVDLLRSEGIEVVVQSTLECKREGREAMLSEIRTLNERLQEYAIGSAIQYIDLNSTMSDKNGLRSELTYDGVHLNGKGYRAWVDILSPCIETP